MDKPTLPIDEVIPALRNALASQRNVILQAPPGAGKTTYAPLALLNEPWLKGLSILMLEPRRLAARAAAARMAALLGEAVGQTVGYRIRFDVKVSSRTRIEVVTEGILTRRLQSDPGLEGVGLIILDEFHERHLDADLALALSLDSQRQLREELRLLVMSATLESRAVAAALGGAPIITSEGRSFPVEIRYASSNSGDLERQLAEVTHRAILQALEREKGDLLVFLPGAGEIRRVENLLKPLAARTPIDVYPLYGDLPWEAQERAIQPAGEGRRKVVLATPIAESSLTIEGIGVVIDSGFARVPRFDPGTGLTRLTKGRISNASAAQRSGRAGRLGPGVCYRLWSETTQRGLMAQPVPEILSADLAPLALQLAQWGTRDPVALSWIDPPAPSAFAQGRRLLVELGALSEEGAITPSGRAMAALPLHPRLAHMIAEGEKKGLGALACDIAALLSEKDLLIGAARRSCDFLERVELLQLFRRQGRERAQSLGADPGACLRADQAARQYRQLLGDKPKQKEIALEEIAPLLALAYPDRVALQRAPGEVRYLLASGRGARLPEQEERLRRPALIVADLDAGETEGKIYLAAAIDIEAIRRELALHLRTLEEIYWDPTAERVVATRTERLGELVISSAPLAKPDRGKIASALLDGIRRLGLAALPWTEEAFDLQARVLSLRHWFPEEGWPDLSAGALQETLELWLGPFLDGITGVTRREHFKRIDLLAALMARLDWEQGRRLDEGAPTHLTVPSGSRLRLEYKPGESPVLAVKLQEMFGLAETPRVAWGKIPVTLHLLSPARRPIQVTQDLRGFWERTYAEVKKELKGRYPKHPWPDDPWNAPPTARARRRPT